MGKHNTDLNSNEDYPDEENDMHSFAENSNSKIFKENEDLKVSNFSKFDDNNNFTCDICGCSFSNGQGLGGHMSRKHPNQSEKYQKKKQKTA